MIRVTSHAVQRFQERVANVPEADAIATLSAPLIEAAANFGCPYVRLGTGQRIVIKDHAVITVLPAKHFVGALNPRRIHD